MNYLEQIVAFYRWKEVNPLPASVIALWHEIMAVCNKAGWPQEFTVPNAVLQSNAGLSRKEFEKARQILIAEGRIHYKKSNRVNQAGKYTILPFSIVQKGQQEGKREGQRLGEREEHGRGTLFKLNETKLNDKEQQQPRAIDYSAYQLFQNNIAAIPSEPVHEQLVEWITRLGDPFLHKAIEECCKSAKTRPSFRLLEKMINDWISQGARTPEDIDRLQEAFRNRADGGETNAVNGRGYAGISRQNGTKETGAVSKRTAADEIRELRARKKA